MKGTANNDRPDGSIWAYALHSSSSKRKCITDIRDQKDRNVLATKDLPQQLWDIREHLLQRFVSVFQLKETTSTNSHFHSVVCIDQVHQSLNGHTSLRWNNVGNSGLLGQKRVMIELQPRAMDIIERTIAPIFDLIYMIVNQPNHATRTTTTERKLFAGCKIVPHH